MGEIGFGKEVLEAKEAQQERNGFKGIKPQEGTIFQKAQDFWKDIFGGERQTDGMNESEMDEADNTEDNLEKALDDYFQDLKEKSECPDTIEEQPFEVDDLEKQPPEKTAEMREQFDDLKADLKKQWEKEHGILWPKYEQDVYSVNGKLIREVGNDYDAHHIQPLSLGGKNEVGNITPLSVEVHYDKQGVHAPDSPYSRMDKILGGMD